MDDQKINELMRDYAAFRQASENLSQKMKDAIEEVKHSESYMLMESMKKEWDAMLSEKDALIRIETVKAFEETGNKKPWVGVGIREVTEIEYDERMATMWAMEKMPAVLTIDKKKFEKVVTVLRAEDMPSYISVKTVPQATISKDLSIYTVDEPSNQ